MKKKYLILLFTVFLWFSTVHAWTEERRCLDVLNSAVAADSRFKDYNIFPKGDLSEVLVDDISSSYDDLSKYSKFRDYRSYRWSSEPLSSLNPRYFFSTRRNNIGTIIAWSNYNISQIVWFGKDSTFDFPLDDTSLWIPSYWDKYILKNASVGGFKEYLLYTHHLNAFPYDLLSCWIVKIVPLDGRTLWEIDESQYFTNTLHGSWSQVVLWWNKCRSWFEWRNVSRWSDDFYEMKANICVLNYAREDYLKMEVISVAYDNGSNRLNEYYTHPLQVQAMQDLSARSNGLRWVQDKFRNLLEDKTCFRVVHGLISNLPSACWWWFRDGLVFQNDLKNNIFTKLWSYIFPIASAKLEVWDDYKPWEVKDTGLVVLWNLPYSLYKKLQGIPNEDFRDLMELSIHPWFESSIAHKKKEWIVITPYEETFLKCQIPYAERFEIVKEFLKNVDSNKFKEDNITYLNPKYGDCIIPFPDKKHRDKLIDISFDSNKALAKSLQGITSDVPLIDEDLVQKEIELQQQYNNKLQQIEKDFNEWKIDSDMLVERKKQATESYEKNQSNLLEEHEKPKLTSYKEPSSWKESNTSNIPLFLVITLFIVWILSMFWAIYFKRKPKK